MTKLSIDVLQPPFLSPGESVHMFQNRTKTSLRRSFKSYRSLNLYKKHIKNNKINQDLVFYIHIT